MDPLDGATESATVGLVGTSVDAVPGLRAIADELTLDFVDGETHGRSDLSLVLCNGRDGLRTLADRQPQAPILPIERAHDSRQPAFGPAVEWDEDRTPPLSIPRDRAADTVRSLLQDGGDTRRFPTLALETESATVAPALFDVALVTDEPGTIARFAVRSNAERVSEVRADGLVVATSAGSRGFARAAGGPVLARETADVTVLAISPFTIDDAPWVGSPDGLALSIGTDGPAAEVQCDGHVCQTISPGSTLHVGSGPTVSVVTPRESTMHE